MIMKSRRAGTAPLDIARQALEVSKLMANAGTDSKNAALRAMAVKLAERRKDIVAANNEDIEEARSSGTPENVLKRLVFSDSKIESRINSLDKIAALPDPVGQVIRKDEIVGEMTAERVRVPLGVILMIYEARPHVSVNAGAFCMKAGNAAILRGGKEARRCNDLLGRLWGESLAESGLPANAIQVISGSHEEIAELLQLEQYINLVIPRGGKSLIEAVARQSRIPVVKHYAGVCHVYVDAESDAEKAADIVIDSKCLMPEVCNAMETVLVSESRPDALKIILEAFEKRGVRVRGCRKTIEHAPNVEKADDSDWETEYLDLVVSIKMVRDVEEAIAHINRYGSHHTDSIVTENTRAAEAFRRGVDSGVVLINASTMYCDGESLGMGAEIGISTDKLHARGPMGLEELTSYKFVITGNGNVMGNIRKGPES